MCLGWVMWSVCGGPATAQSTAAQPQNAVPPSAAPSGSAQTADKISTAILHRALYESVWGKPAHCVVRQSISVFDKRMSGIGEYVRIGGGSGRMKFSLRFSAHDHLNSLLQVCDGRRLMTIEEFGDQKHLSEVDLERVRNPLVWTTESVRNDPTTSMYLAIGGQAEALRKLCQQYHWTHLREAKLPVGDVWILSGQLATTPVVIHGQAPIDLKLNAPNQLGLLPTRAEVTVGTQESEVPFWLYSVLQTRTAEELGEQGQGYALRVSTEWAEPRPLAEEQLPAEFFEAPSVSGEHLTDETELYLPPTPRQLTAQRLPVNR